MGAGDHLFHNNGDGTFTDVTAKAGVGDASGYYGLGTVFADVNNDGKPDLIVADDSTPNYLYINKGDGTFDDQSYMSGFALNQDGREAANMGIAVGDYENNGHLDLVTTTFSDDYDIVFHNDGTGNFQDLSYRTGIAAASIPFVGFGDGFLDYDNDGWKDLLIVNGNVYPQADQHPEWGMSYAQRPLLFHNQHNGTFALVPAVEGSGLARVSVGRGAAFGDLFNDGKIDVVINNLDGVPVLLRNVSDDHNHWVEMHLVGGPGSPRDAVGATVYLTAGGVRQRGDVLSGGKLFVVERHAGALWAGRGGEGGCGGDPLAGREDGEGDAAGSGSDLHDRGGPRGERGNRTPSRRRRSRSRRRRRRRGSHRCGRRFG